MSFSQWRGLNVAMVLDRLTVNFTVCCYYQINNLEGGTMCNVDVVAKMRCLVWLEYFFLFDRP